ncbi:MAG: hypothetical protein GDA36_11840 [Rhodobacteraceae bacterium]|nr:hypothetical protein [Paracoccaceae bacterium]
MNLPSQPCPTCSQGVPSGPKCYHCNKRGHVMTDCQHLKTSL